MWRRGVSRWDFVQINWSDKISPAALFRDHHHHHHHEEENSDDDGEHDDPCKLSNKASWPSLKRHVRLRFFASEILPACLRKRHQLAKSNFAAFAQNGSSETPSLQMLTVARFLKVAKIASYLFRLWSSVTLLARHSYASKEGRLVVKVSKVNSTMTN